MEFDCIVVGAGAAGCVIAARLSEQPNRRVLLLEAGPDIFPAPPSIQSPYPISHGVPSYRWPGMNAVLKAPLDEGPPPMPSPFPQARVVGGGGSLMGMFALRGVPADYDDWRDAGAAGWGWDDVLASFRRLEQDHDFGGPKHGGDGPIPIRRHPRADWPMLARALGDAFEEDGFPFIADANADFRDGHMAMPSSNLPDRRYSSAEGYLDARTRARPNFTLIANSEVDKLLFSGKRVTGVSVASPSGEKIYAARTIFLCAGALKSPQILLQSGVGPASELTQVGVKPVQDLAGVGRNLANHPIIYLSAYVPPAFRKPRGPAIFSALRYSSGISDCPTQDMVLPLLNRTGWHELGDCTALFGASVYKPLSRGAVTLKRRNDTIAPHIDLAFFSDARDLTRLTDGLKRVHLYLRRAAAAMPGLIIFAPTDTRLMNRLAFPSAMNGMIAQALAAALDGPEYLRRRALQRVGTDPTPILNDESALRAFAHRYASPMFHPAGTCRLGAADDPYAVVDPRCRVIGIDGLRIADASVMPAIVRANTNIPTLMIGEKAAAMFLEDEKQGDGA